MIDNAYWYMVKIDDPAFKCFAGEPHWDVCRQEAKLRIRRSEPGILDATANFNLVNVMCILGEEANVRHIVDLHNASLPKSLRKMSVGA